MNVNPKAPYCDGFLRGYCKDGEKVLSFGSSFVVLKSGFIVQLALLLVVKVKVKVKVKVISILRSSDTKLSSSMNSL